MRYICEVSSDSRSCYVTDAQIENLETFSEKLEPIFYNDLQKVQRKIQTSLSYLFNTCRNTSVRIGNQKRQIQGASSNLESVSCVLDRVVPKADRCFPALIYWEPFERMTFSNGTSKVLHAGHREQPSSDDPRHLAEFTWLDEATLTTCPAGSVSM